MVLVVIEPVRLLARVAARRRMALVTAQAHEVAVLDLDLEPAVALAQDARRRFPHADEHRQSGLVMQPYCRAPPVHERELFRRARARDPRRLVDAARRA